MIKKDCISLQELSWIKSNKGILSKKIIGPLFYPETIDELIQLVESIRLRGEDFETIGYSSNTLFLPSYHGKNLICTTKLKQVYETDSNIICECGIPVNVLSKSMIAKGYVGFEGLTDLPGTIGAAVYGNCGCRGCSINALLDYLEYLDEDGQIIIMNIHDLQLEYRSTILKRNRLSCKGIILRIFLKKVIGDSKDLILKAEKNHEIRKRMQPSGANNLGTTFNGGNELKAKGYIVKLLEKLVSFALKTKDPRITYPKTLKLIGKGKFSPYTYYWNRYMFTDEKAHELFDEYFRFLKTIYKDVRLEIEIRK